MALFSVFSSAFKSPIMCILNRTADGSNICCANYHSSNGSCDSCTPGYFGDNCEKMCPEGTFGDLCGGRCLHCSLEECDPVKGCPDVTHNGSPVTVLDDTSFVTVSRHQIIHESSSNLSPSFKSTSSYKPSTYLSTKTIQRTTISIATDPTDKNSFNILYLLVGVGALISLFLLVIIIQLCLRSKSAKRRISRRKSGDYNDIKEPKDHLGKSRQSDRKKYNELRHYRNRDTFYQHIESDYQEIDQCLEMVNDPSKEKGKVETKKLEGSPKSNDPYLSPVAEKEQTNNSGSDAYVEPVEQEPFIKTKHVRSNIDPFNEQSSSKGEIHSYIEILESGEIQPEKTLSDENCENGSKSSSSYDDVVGEASAMSHNLSDRKDDTYLDVVI